MTHDDEEVDCCPQCGFAFMEGEPVSQLQGFCDNCGQWETILVVHTVICWQDHLARMPKQYSRNRQIGLRRLN